MCLLRFTIIIAIQVILISCDSSTNTITIIEDGNKTESYQINKDSLRHGLTQKFYPSGMLFETSNYVNGDLEGERLIYYESGQIEIKENYCGGTFCDSLVTYYENGQKRFVGIYTKGVMNGIVKGFYKTGELKEEVTFEENIEQGPFKEFHKNGNIKWSGTYLNGPNEFGELIEYDDEGIIIKKMLCDSIAICKTFWHADK